ncbi:VOC family protein [Aliivibrio logei]|uniref:VOC family protein n=1 Tax=Aliivibrio logei TaxID=688 RepID=UPI0035C92D0E
MNQHEKLNYVEFGAKDLESTKSFFSSVFGWNFVDYGPEYSAFSNQGLDGGFFKADSCSQTNSGGALLVFYSADIESTLSKVVQSDGEIIRPSLWDIVGALVAILGMAIIMFSPRTT